MVAAVVVFGYLLVSTRRRRDDDTSVRGLAAAAFWTALGLFLLTGLSAALFPLSFLALAFLPFVHRVALTTAWLTVAAPAAVIAGFVVARS